MPALPRADSGQSQKRLLSLREMVEVYGATLWFWRSAVWAGHIPVVTVGKKQFLDSRDVEAFIQRHKE